MTVTSLTRRNIFPKKRNISRLGLLFKKMTGMEKEKISQYIFLWTILTILSMSVDQTLANDHFYSNDDVVEFPDRIPYNVVPLLLIRKEML